MLQTGSRVTGKWTGTDLKIEKSLGRGANGAVYLVRSGQGFAAMKVCDRPQDIALEWGILTAIRPTPPFFPKPILMDDDASGQRLYFYVMEWVAGQTLDAVVAGLTEPVLYEVMRQVLLGLGQLHQAGYAFCDVKAQNILIATAQDVRVRFVDAGGVTQFGRSVRQFTPFSDRAFWGLGTRRAEASYDVMAFALMMVCAYTSPPSDLAAWSVEQRKNWLSKSVRRFPEAAYIPELERMLDGKVADATVALQGLLQAHGQRNGKSGSTSTAGRARQASSKGRVKPLNQVASTKPAAHRSAAHTAPPMTGPVQARHRPAADWTEWAMWLSLVTAGVVTFAALGTLLGWFG